MTDLPMGTSGPKFEAESPSLNEGGWRAKQEERLNLCLQESLFVAYMIGLLLWASLVLTLMVYMTLMTPVLAKTTNSHLLIAANLLALSIGVAFIICYRRFQARQQALTKELREQKSDLSRQALQTVITDRLTGLHTFVYFWQRVEGEVERAQRYCHSFSILIIDLHGLNLVNQRYGSLTGDRLLRELAQAVVAGSLRTTDLPARYGMDQFAILLPETNAEGALRLGERIREQATKIISVPSGIPLTMALSVVSFPDDGMITERLLRTAEERLKDAKVASLSVNDLTEEAGVQPGVFLNGFNNYPFG